ncbi:MAG TPA: S9 family peptidase [Bacteroidia bacterium]|nr:S9 family peptidase [Bacteroidia bacterium]
MKKHFTFLLCFSISFVLFSQKQNITMDDIWTYYRFHPKGIDELRSTSDGERYTVLSDISGGKAIIAFSYATGKAVDTLMTGEQLAKAGDTMAIEDYELGKGEKNILLSTASEQIYRHSSIARYSVWNREKKTITPIMDKEKVLYATFSPDGNSVAFVFKGNLYVRNLIDGKLTQVTKDGSDDIFNGVSDWVYEEEFVVTRAYFWCPDSKSIAYYRFDDSKVPVFSMNEYHDSLYPTVYSFRYPKAGTPNPTVSIKIYNIPNATITNIIPPGSFEYVPRIKWTLSSSLLSVQFMDRHQDSLVFVLADAGTGKTTLVFTETSKTYIDINDALTFINNNKEFIWESDNDGYDHLYRYAINGKLINQITKGKWDVTDFKGINEKAQTLYYSSSETSPIDRDIYCIKIDGTEKKKLSAQTGFNSAEFSSDHHFYINTFSSAETPDYITVNNSDGKQLRVLEDNKELKERITHFNLGQKKFFSFTTSQGNNLNGWMVTPPDFDSTKKYPVFMCVYGGPGINTVNNSWDGLQGMWYQMLAQKGYIVASVDNRGTGARGSEFKKCTYLHLGKLETEDQIEGAKYFQSRRFVDATRVGIWGWSYGGYMAANCITKGADYFKAAISVAPVTDWKFYDSIYTERYMRTPDENKEGYKEGSPVNYADEVKGHYMLVAGTGDDNVHFQNTVVFTSALEKAEKPFSLMIFPDKNHSIHGGNTRKYLFNQMTDFIVNNL